MERSPIVLLETLIAAGHRLAMRTKLSVCNRKRDFGSEANARAAVLGDATLRPYRCNRCGRFHLTSRTKGKRVPRPLGA